MKKRLRFLFLEPFYGGSHRDVADGLKAYSRHHIELVTLPDRFWKWRMRGAALYWIGRLTEPCSYDGLIVSSLMNLADLKALWPGRFPPALVYFHENQLNYPLSPGERRDFQYGFTNIVSALTADRIAFNSQTHRQAFFKALPGYIAMMPDCRPDWVCSAISAKTQVLYPGCHFGRHGSADWQAKDRPPLIIWNHRWEHDKNPEGFLRCLQNLKKRDRDFRVAVLGQSYTRRPEAFNAMKPILGTNIVQFGYEPDRESYYRWLRRGSIVISTALQENFGIAVIEAMRQGCLPLLPDRLSYPEILPQSFHKAFLYKDLQELDQKLDHLITHFDEFRDAGRDLSLAMGRYAWSRAVHHFDDTLADLAATASD